MKNTPTLIIIIIPFVLLCLLIARAEYHIRSGEQWSFEITGYDPRDVLRGHYLQFRLAYDWDSNSSSAGYCSNGQSCCLCLTKTDQRTPKVRQTSCEIAKKQCDGFMLFEHKNALNRFYIPEIQASKAEAILLQARRDNNAYLVVSINKKGEPKIVDLTIGDQPVLDLLKPTNQ